jgi:hypothetical protein
MVTSKGRIRSESEFTGTTVTDIILKPDYCSCSCLVAQYLHFRLYDDDGITSDDFLGEAFMKLDGTVDQNQNQGIVKVIELIKEGKRKNGRGSLVVRSFANRGLSS